MKREQGTSVSYDNNDTDERSTQRTFDSNTRRRFIAGSGGALAGLTLMSSFGAGSAIACGDDKDEKDDEEMEGATPPEMVENEFEDDIEILNFARTLEFLEARFYEEGLANIDEDELLASDPLQEFGDPIQDRVYGDLETIKGHEQDHAETLGAVIEDLGGDPVDEPEFEFGTAVEEPAEFIATGGLLEDVGVSAYAGAAPFIEEETLVAPALSIHSVEARHASFLRVLDDEVGFPTPYDQPRSRSEVLALASGFFADGMDEMMGDDDEGDY